MPSSYRRVLSRPGGAAMSATGAVARLPISMMTLGVVVAVSARYGSYGLAGQISAAYIVGNAAVAVAQGRLADRWGQAPVLTVGAVLFGASTGLLVHAIVSRQSAPWPHLWAALAGASIPPVGSMVRARWASLATEPRDRRTAFAIESVVDEVVFVVGPTLVTFLSTVYAAQTGLLVALSVGTAGPLALAAQRRTQPTAHRSRASSEAHRLPWATLAPLMVAAAALGSLFGAMEVATVAFASDQGHRPLSGLLLAGLSAASMLGGLAIGARPPALSLLTQLRIGMAALTAGFVALPFVGAIWLLGVLMVLAGFAIAPTLIACMSLVEEVSPRARLTEAMAWTQTGMSAGIAPGAWLAGLVADRVGGGAAFWVCVISGLVATVATRATRAQPHAALSSVP